MYGLLPQGASRHIPRLPLETSIYSPAKKKMIPYMLMRGSSALPSMYVMARQWTGFVAAGPIIYGS